MTREEEIALLEERIIKYRKVIVDCIDHKDAGCELLCKRQLKKSLDRLEELMTWEKL